MPIRRRKGEVVQRHLGIKGGIACSIQSNSKPNSVWSIYAACLCGWTEQRANQMCYLYGMKVRLLAEYVRNAPVTLNLTFDLWTDLKVFEDGS